MVSPPARVPRTYSVTTPSSRVMVTASLLKARKWSSSSNRAIRAAGFKRVHSVLLTRTKSKLPLERVGVFASRRADGIRLGRDSPIPTISFWVESSRSSRKQFPSRAMRICIWRTRKKPLSTVYWPNRIASATSRCSRWHRRWLPGTHPIQATHRGQRTIPYVDPLPAGMPEQWRRHRTA
jgi:hypothetical protein